MKSITKSQWGVTDILNYSWQLFLDNFRLIFLITMLVYVPIELISWYVDPAYYATGIVQNVGPAIGSEVILGLVGLIAFAGVAIAVDKKIKKRRVDHKSAITQAVNRWPYIIGTNIIMAILLIILFILLIVPGILFAVFWTFALYAVILRGKFGLEALKYSKSLVKGKWWKVLRYTIVLVILIMIPAVIIGVASTYIPTYSVANVIPYLLIDVIAMFLVTAFVVFFNNLEAFRYKKKEKLISL